MNTNPLFDLLSHTALKGAAVLLVALFLGLILHRMAAARRYALWITAVATLALLPLATGLLPAWHVLPKAEEMNRPVMEPPQFSVNAAEALPAESSAAIQPAASPVPPMQAPAAVAFWSISWQDVVEALPMVWMLTAALLLLRLGLSAWRLHRLEAALQPGECAALDQSAQEMGLRRRPRLLIGPADSVPMVWGVFRPRLLLPQGFENWPHEKQRGVLLHELAHLKRSDPLALWLAQWVKALHWFNPLAWLILRHLRADQERACDDTVLRQGVRASDYAQSLLDLSRHNRLAPGLSLCALTITRSAPVEARVQAILDPARRREGLTLRWLVVLLGGALFITLPLAMLRAAEGSVLRGRILDRNGVVLAETTKEKVRNYPLKALAAHVVGYTRPPDEKHVQYHGGAGFEKQQDATLTSGKDATLTLDMRLQALVHQAMKDGGVTRGAAVVLDPRTGEILATVSLPSYDPNLFIPAIRHETWNRWLKDQDVPLLNRCLKGYAPGSTFKVLTGLAGVAAGFGGQKYDCRGSVTYGNNVMKCWIHAQNGGGHGMLGMSDSLAVSCNCYWYQFGNAVGIEQIERMGRLVGFGSAYGISEDESAGILAGPNWLKQQHPKESWSDGATANTAIGQGYMLATPLQMAVLAATVGNGGRVPQPCILKPTEASRWREDLTQGTLTAADVEPLREGMRLAVNGDSGTGKPARSDKVVIAGKTGTSLNWRITADKKRVEDTLGWFIGFAPFENPQIAFAILKNGARTGGSDCGPIAKRIVEEALKLPADGSGEVKPVEEKGAAAQSEASFNRVTQLLQIAKTTSARVISRGSGPEAGSTLVIDKGSLDGIMAESPVITLDGLVGKTAKPEPHATKVILLTDKLCFVSAKVAGGMEQGILHGESVTDEAPPQLHLRFLSRDSKISTGSKVYTSGEGGIFPADLHLGRVKLFTRGDISGEAIVEPVVDFAHLEQVFVVETQTMPPEPEMVAPSMSTGQAQNRQRADSEIVMKLELINQWSALKRVGLLAALPASARPFHLGDKHPERQMKSVLEFHFVAPRDAVRRWLVDSHCMLRTVEKRAAMGFVETSHTLDEPSALEWPARPEVFTRTYAAARHCTITVQSTENDDVQVKISHAKPSILIAPQESREPRPAGPLAPEYRGKGLTQVDTMPALDSALQSLRSAISADERDYMPALRMQPVVKVKALKPETIPVALPFPLDRFKGELSEESQKVIARSYLEEQGRMFLQSRRMQQALIVQPPKA